MLATQCKIMLISNILLGEGTVILENHIRVDRVVNQWNAITVDNCGPSEE